MHEEAEATTFLIGLGLQFDGENLRVSVSSERRWKLRQALKALCKRRTASPRQLQMILGHVSFAFLLRRPLLSILVHSFRFAYLEHEFRPRSLWMSVRKELEVASSLLTLAFAELDFQTSVRVGVSDASKWGWAAHESEWSLPHVEESLKWSERWRWRHGVGDASRERMGAALRGSLSASEAAIMSMGSQMSLLAS